MAVYERVSFQITTKSPVHIGGAGKITRFEFILSNNYIYPVSENRLSLFLKKHHLITDYCSEVERQGHRFNLADFFRSKGIILRAEDLENLSSGQKIHVIGNANQIQDYRPFIRDGFGTPYIPGTSIKGVFRTAIIYNILKEFKNREPKNFQREIEERINRDIDRDNKKEYKKKFFDWGNEEYLENFVLMNKRKSPNTDWLRMLHITDAYSQNRIQTILIPVNIVKKQNGWVYKEEYSGQKTTIWVECLPPKTSLNFEVTWDRSLLEEFKRQNSPTNMPESIESVLNHLIQWAEDIREFERNFLQNHPLQKWYDINQPNFRIGFGSGMTATTILMLLSESLRKKIRNYAGADRADEEAPKSRRLYVKDNFAIPLGWAMIERSEKI